MEPIGSPAAILIFLALLAVQILFGVNYVISKVVVMAFPPLVWASFRIVVASITLLAIVLLGKRKHPTDGAKFFIPLIGFSLLGIIINQGSFLVGLRYTTSTNSAILNTLIPVFTLLIVTLRGQEPLTPARAVGFLSALAGVLVIRKVEDFSFSNQTMIGDLLTVLNCFSYSLFLSFSKKFLEQHDRVWTTTWLFLYGSVGLTLVAAPDWIHFHWPAMSGMLLGCMVFAIFGGTLATYFLNIWALSYTRSSSVALFIYLQPVIASLLAWVWFREAMTPRTIFSWVLIMGGFLLALTKPKARPLILEASDPS